MLERHEVKEEWKKKRKKGTNKEQQMDNEV